jgi:flagellar export protein FliJ
MEREQMRALDVLLHIKEDHLRKLFLKRQELESLSKKNTEQIIAIHQHLTDESRLSHDVIAFATFPAFLKHSLEMIEAYEHHNQQIDDEMTRLKKKMKLVFTELKTVETIIHQQKQNDIKEENKKETQFLDEISIQNEVYSKLM